MAIRRLPPSTQVMVIDGRCSAEVVALGLQQEAQYLWLIHAGEECHDPRPPYVYMWGPDRLHNLNPRIMFPGSPTPSNSACTSPQNLPPHSPGDAVYFAWGSSSGEEDSTEGEPPTTPTSKGHHKKPATSLPLKRGVTGDDSPPAAKKAHKTTVK